MDISGNKSFQVLSVTLKAFDSWRKSAHRIPLSGIAMAAGSGVVTFCSFMDDFFSAIARLWCTGHKQWMH